MTNFSPTDTEKTVSFAGPVPKQMGVDAVVRQIGVSRAVANRFGGFAIMYLGEQRHPVHRRVAHQVLKASMRSNQVLARFEAERQALAMMDRCPTAAGAARASTENGLTG